MMGLDPNLFSTKVESMILGKGLSFLFQRIGWAGGLFFLLIFYIFDPELSTAQPRAFEEASPEPSTSSTWSGSWIGRWLNREEESSTNGSEDSFEINVLLEPFPAEQAAPHQAVIHHNLSLESSLLNRIAQLEREHSIFLLDHPQGGYWAGVKESLNKASTQVEYDALLASESQDLVIRELRHRGARLIQGFFPPHNPISNETLIHFFNHNLETLEEELPRSVDVRDINTGVSLFRTHDIAVVDRVEILNLNKMIKDLNTNGPASYSFYRFCQDLN